MPTAGEYKHAPTGTPCHCCVKRRIRYTSSIRRKSCLRKPSVSSNSFFSAPEQIPYLKFKKVTFNPVLSVCSYDDDSNENFKVEDEVHEATEQLPSNPTTASARKTVSTCEHFPIEKTSSAGSGVTPQKFHSHVPPLPEYDRSSQTQRDTASLQYTDDSGLLDDFSEIAYWDSDEESDDQVTLISSESSPPVLRDSKQNSFQESHFKSEPHSDYFTGKYTFSPTGILDEVDSRPLLGNRGLKSQVSLCSNRRVTLRKLNSINTLKATSAAFFWTGCIFLVSIMYVFLFMCSDDDTEDCV